MSFRNLGLSEPLLRAVAAQGYATPTPIQSEAIPPLLAGRDVLGSAQTGTGKTAAFALPLLHRLLEALPVNPRGRRAARALILCPTRELASQIGHSFDTYGRHSSLRFLTIYGGVGSAAQVRALRQGIDILVATPGRLIDLMDQGFVNLSGIETVVVDEADRMLDMGFLPSVRRIVQKLPSQRQTVLLSATMPEPIVELAASLLRNPVHIHIRPIKATTELIDQFVRHVPRHRKSNELARLLDARNVDRALVFTRTKRGADRVVKQLAQSGLRAVAIHGNKSQSVRQRALTHFKSRRTRILVATDIAARGIDVEGISHVINYDLPQEPETYIHRIGRTGRAGAAGIAVSLCDGDERALLSSIERTIRKKLKVETPLSGASQPGPALCEAVVAGPAADWSTETIGDGQQNPQKVRTVNAPNVHRPQPKARRRKWRASRRRP